MPARRGRGGSARSPTSCSGKASSSISSPIRRWRKKRCASCCKQGTGGVLLFNLSKQAVNPGANFGPYGLPKAATMLLMRQYALDYGEDGIRSNGVNADRIRSGLLTDAMIKDAGQGAGRVGGRLYERQSAARRGHWPRTWRRPSWRWPRRARPPAISRRWTAAISPPPCAKVDRIGLGRVRAPKAGGPKRVLTTNREAYAA